MSAAALAQLDQTGARPANRDLLADLRRQVAGLERAGQVGEDAVGLGVPEIDRHLPDGGLAGGAVHEVLGGAATGFAVSIAARLEGPVLWCLDASRREDPYGPGLKALGFDPERLILVRCRGLKEMLWTMEEGLRSTAPSLVIAEPEANIGLIESRRLQLAAEAGGTLGLILRDDGKVGRLAPSAVASRWQVDPASGGGWHLTLRRCRGAAISGDEWKVRHNDATGHLALAAEAGDRSGATADRLCPV
jgi:protein ImuA